MKWGSNGNLPMSVHDSVDKDPAWQGSEEAKQATKYVGRDHLMDFGTRYEFIWVFAHMTNCDMR